MAENIKTFENLHSFDKLHAKELDQAERIIQLIVLSLGDEKYGANIDQVKEIVVLETITPIPDSPSFIQGITNVRGEVIPIINLKERFSIHLEGGGEEKHIVITEQQGNLYGLMVDEVTEVLRLPEKEFKPAPKVVTGIDRRYISGVLTLDERLITMLDLSKVLSEEELIKLSRSSSTKKGPTKGDKTSAQQAEEKVDDVEKVIRKGKEKEVPQEQKSEKKAKDDSLETKKPKSRKKKGD